MKTKRLSVWFIFLVVIGVILGFSTWHQWSDNQTTTLERMRPIAPVATFSHGGSIRYIAYDPKNPELIATAGDGDFVKIWNRNKHDSPKLSLEVQRDIAKNIHMVGIAFSPTDNWIATRTFWTLEIWDSLSGNRINSLDTTSSYFTIHPEGKYIVMHTDGLTLWNISDPNKIKADIMLPPQMGWESINLDGLERTHNYDGRDVIRLDIPMKYKNAGMNQIFRSIAFSPDGKWFAGGRPQHNSTTKKWRSVLTIWDFEKQKMFKAIEREEPRKPDLKPNDKRNPSLSLPTSNRIQSIKFSPDNRFLGLAADNGFTIWSLPDWQIYHEVLDRRISDIAFSPDGKMLAVCDVKGIVLWSVDTLTPVALLGTGGFLGSSVIEFSPDGRTLAGGGYGGLLKIWDMSEFYEK